MAKLFGNIDFRQFAPLQSTITGIAANSAYAASYGLSNLSECVMDIPTFELALDRAEVSHAVLVPGAATNEELADYVARSTRLFGISGLDDALKSGRDMRAEVALCRAMGFHLCGLAPYLHRAAANDRMFYPIYESCCETGMGIVLHSSFHMNAALPIKYSSPIHLDDVARDFPTLPIVASHGGWPWLDDMVAVAWRHANVFIEISGQRNRYVAEAGSGWELLFYYMKGPLRDKVIWGSTWPYLPVERQKAELDLIPVKAEIKEKLLKHNPRRILQACGAIPSSG